ncbi:histone-like nucleoid-structuring protein, MvaT/MvaU family [Pseudomonas sp. KU43P]|uniref:histone-like nucleoid-structuring protein, MvaT/MvaU family n=1 Tax=Pseudomonas sp. KU43P TaxID=2487887 RepID=UPI0012A9691D|nr:histone-like nucleoid-structuring protein, MvaT/MvaU family [Pseudomonas sp. KU43P]BBH47647.1 transcriptional regulator [Pseudomonas sp. KU43P]
MSRLAEFRALEQKLAAQLAELESLKNDSALKQEIEFEGKLRSLLGEYGYSSRDVIAILDPAISVDITARPTSKARKPRQVKVFKNPHTGEVVETKGGNHRTLKEWKTKYGAGTVEAWIS